MQLDHFRPQEHFSELSVHPYNLHLACPKCNVLKTSDWPCAKEADSPSFLDGVGYLDRFKDHAEMYLKVGDDGEIIPLAGPIDYMIKKMLLNRKSRTNVRRKRLITHKKTQLLEGINQLVKKLATDVELEKISSTDASLKKDKIIELFVLCSKI